MMAIFKELTHVAPPLKWSYFYYNKRNPRQGGFLKKGETRKILAGIAEVRLPPLRAYL